MQTIETKSIVEADDTLTVQVPLEVSPGEHQVVVVLEGTVGDTFFALEVLN